MKRKLGIALVAAGLAAGPAKAALVVNIYESGTNVVASHSGSINTSALIHDSDGTSDNAIYSSVAAISMGVDAPGTGVWNGFSGPVSWGTGDFVYADEASGDVAGVIGAVEASAIFLPSGYVSGDPLAGDATFWGHTIASLGLVEGSYEYTWGSGPTADSLTVNVIPEPSVIGMMCLMGSGMLAIRRFFLM